MYVVELTYDDNPARLQARPAHRELLADLHNRGVVLAAGPWDDGSGALLVLDVETEDEVDQLLADDPYYRSPGLTVTSKRRWTPVVI
jgi:uncharacterized protein YciI